MFCCVNRFSLKPQQITSQFLSLLSSFNLTQHVSFPTHNRNHTLDLVISSSDTSLAPSVSTTLLSVWPLSSLYRTFGQSYTSAFSCVSFFSPSALNRHRLYDSMTSNHLSSSPILQSSRLSRLSVNGIQQHSCLHFLINMLLSSLKSWIVSPCLALVFSSSPRFQNYSSSCWIYLQTHSFCSWLV